MKQLLLLWLLAFSSTITVAQTTWTGAGGTNNWSTAGNWSTGLVPTASNDVIIPGGFTVDQNVNVSIKSLDMQGDAVLNKSTNHHLRTYEPSTIGANATLNWSAGSLRGGSTLINNGTINTADENLGITDAETTLINNGQLNMAGSGRIYLYAGTTINNSSSGTISFISADASIRGALLINEGSIVTDLPNQTDEVVIRSGFQNNNGTIQVDSGVFNLWSEGSTHTLTDGTYNVASGATFDWDGNLTIEGTLTGNIEGTLNSRNYIYVNESTTATLSFTGNETLNWLDGSILGGGTLENNGTIATADENLGISGSSTTLLNHGELIMAGTGYIYLYASTMIDNTTSGTITFVSAGASIRGAQLINEGSIVTDLPNETDEVMIRSGFQNNNGTIQVNSGVFNLWAEANTHTLTDGIYNVASGATFDWDGNITLVGTLTGNIQGTLNSRSYIIVNETTTATLSFTGNETLNWLDGSILGGGTLENNGIIATDNENLGISQASTMLLNHGQLLMEGTGNIYIYAGASINNVASGTISFIADGASIQGTSLINEGLITTDFINGTETGNISASVQNLGVIEAISGTLNFSNALENMEEGRLSGVATIDIPSATNFTNNGIVSPGLSPGILSIIGDYSSTASSVLEIEINGLNAGIDYDVLEITGNNVVFEGMIDIALGFDPEIGDTFTIATTTGTITSQNLTSPVTVTANGYDFTFVVSYPNDNAVVLTLDEQTLGLEEVSLSESVMMYPNPTKNVITLKQANSINLVAIEIIDVTGKRVQYINLTNLGETHTLDLSNYAPGVYYARINTSNGSVTKKIIKQ